MIKEYFEEGEKLFSRVIGGKNFVTSDIVGYYANKKTNMWFELSKGKVFSETIYGVTVIQKVDGVYIKNHELSRPFPTFASAKEYINSFG